MQTEAQIPQPIPAPDTPEIAPAGESTSVKKQHGGKRPGAGRKPNLVKRLIGRLTPLSAGEILHGIDVEGTIAEIMKKGTLSLKQRTLADLMDRAWGRPAQAVSVSGAVVHAHWFGKLRLIAFSCDLLQFGLDSMRHRRVRGSKRPHSI
jgi:hypothetical protein